MNTATLIFLCVIVFGVGITHCAGQVKGTERCICTGKLTKRVRLNRLATLEIFPASPFCSKIEIVVTVKKTGRKLCIDPNGRQGRKFLNKKGPPKRKRGKKKRGN